MAQKLSHHCSDRGGPASPTSQGGFTLVELVVVVGIFTVMSAVTLARFPSFSQNVSLKRTVQEVALAIRESQVFALGVKRFGSGTGAVYPGYGSHFAISAPASFSVFADTTGDRKQTNDTEVLERFSIQGGDRIINLCGNKRTTPADCGLATLDISFLRPSPVAMLIGPSGSEYADVEIVIRSPGGTEREIVVWKTGQISIENVQP